jgi:DMSO/TMAO reductase YedYZ molybdopterin-dependent catalytic subunit
VPAVPLERFRLGVDGLVRNRLSLDWEAFQALRWTTLRSDIHCVTS